MRDQVRRIWLPGLLATFTAYAGQLVIFRYLEPPRIFHRGNAIFFVSYDWLALLVVCGAFAAWLSYREGGTPRERLFVAQFPSVAALAMFLAAGIASILDKGVPASTRALGFLGFMCCSVLLPSIALLIGATPVIAFDQFGPDRELKA